MPVDRIPLAEFARRRRGVCAALKRAVGVVFAGDGGAQLTDRFRPHPHFEYLTGVTDEPGAVLVLDPSHPVEARREMLCLRPLDPETDQWDGLRLRISHSLRERTGFQSIYRVSQLPRILRDAAARTKRMACLHPLARYDEPISPDLRLFKRVADRVPGVGIEDRTDVVARMRAVKSRNEIMLIQQAVDITATGFEAMMRSIRPGMNEFDVQEIIEHTYRTSGSRGTAFGTIVGAGVNSTVLHYRANDQIIEDGDLICVDSGAAFAGYGGDVTRTIPANGRFSERHREVYEIVLRAELAAIRAVKPGVTFAALDRVARAVITKAGFGDAFIHSIGHHLGLETHDISPETPLRSGAVITIEPGIYLPQEKIGIRIEDDILVTKEGARNLSAKIPKAVAEIEKVMAGRHEGT